MFHDISLTDLLFRLSIFAILMYKCYFLIKQHFIPLLKSTVQDEHNHLTELLEKEKLLLSTRKRFENQIYQQKQMFTLLEQKVHQWHQALAEDKSNAEKAGTVRQAKLRHKVHLQQDYQCMQQAMQAIAPTILNQAEVALKQQYAGADGQAHLQTLVTALTSESGRP